MEKELKSFFKSLVLAPSPSGFEQPAQNVYRSFVKPYADELLNDVHGNVIALKKGTGKLRVMIVGHADEIGMMVRYIDDDGFIHFTAIGGIDATILPGLKVKVYHGNKVYRGLIGRKPIHLLKGDEKGRSPQISDLWIDIGAKNKKDSEKKVCVGDFITFDPGMEMLSRDLVTTKATDNKSGVFVAAGVLKALSGEKTKASIYAVSSVQEEIGLRGATTSAFGIDPHIGIAIDVTHATDYPGMDKKQVGDIKLGGGPVLAIGANINPRILELLKKAAADAGIKPQFEAAPRGTGTDANAIQLTRSGVATGLISIPNRYMHTPTEIVSFSDLEGTVKILAEFVRKLDDKTNLIP
ncbi:MAG: M42 family metallopeptidase [Candidatus Cloacimonetes bacterium]|nr:M42 family metallopeptidase [Candidatus Cloacimonadota bacterium]